MKQSSRPIIFGLVMFLALLTLSAGCTKGNEVDTGKNSAADDLSQCSEKCAGTPDATCCKECCKGNYVWTPDSCQCHDQ